MNTRGREDAHGCRVGRGDSGTAPSRRRAGADGRADRGSGSER